MDIVRSSNWSGSIPVVLTLAAASLGTTIMPHPIHVMVNRCTLLHVGLRDAIKRLNTFAPASINSDGVILRKEPEASQSDGNGHQCEKDSKEKDVRTSDGNKNKRKKWKFPVCWLEDEETQLPLRWHIFAGVLFDMLATSQKLKLTHPFAPQSSSSLPRLERRVPWKIRLHFSSYPTGQLLSLDDNIGSIGDTHSEAWTTIERSFKNSLKQALFLQYGKSKVAMNMSKHIHTRLWEAVVCSKYQIYRQMNADLQAISTSVLRLLPVRLYVDSKPPIQRPCRPGRRGDEDESSITLITLGSLLVDWLPDLFCSTLGSAASATVTSEDDDSCCGDKTTSGVTVAPISETCRWIVAGIYRPPLSIAMLDLWRSLCHPDHFLYIVVLSI